MNKATIAAIERHYKHAKEKHPYFCDIICHDKTYFDSASFLLDAIAVLLRVVDVLEGRQALGRPKECGVAK